MKSPNGVEIELGQRWKEVDPRFERIVEVVGLDSESFDRQGGVMIRTVGSRRIGTWARLSRFNGKRGGYELVEAEPVSLR
jgi:hypothetical protein